MCQSLWGFLLPLCTQLHSWGGLTYSRGDVCFHLSFASSPLFYSLVNGVGVQCFTTPVKLDASTTYYCSPPFRASLEAHLWESEFLQLFMLVHADSCPSWSLGLIVGPELTSRFVADVSH